MKAWLWIFIGIAGITAAGQEADLVAVTAVSHRIRLDIRYATTNNFTGRAVYPAAKAFLRREYERAALEKTTPDCREGCHGCFGARYETDCRLS